MSEFFPDSYDFRPQQQKIIKEIGHAIKTDQMCLVEAPPGTGKTMAALAATLPYANPIYDGRIYWLGSFQNIYQNLTEDILTMNKEKNVSILLSLFIAKSKMCFQDFRKKSDFYASCSKAIEDKKCAYFENTYNRNRKGEIESITEEAKSLIRQLEASFRRGRYKLKKKTIWALIAKSKCKHTFCPYEIMRSLVGQSEIFAGDYNYVFRHKIKERMDETLGLFDSKRRILIIDEADKFYERMLSQLTVKLSSVMLTRIIDRLKTDIIRMRKENHAALDQYKHFLNFMLDFEKLIIQFIRKELALKAGEEKPVWKQTFIQFLESVKFQNTTFRYIDYCHRIVEIIDELYPTGRWNSQFDEFMYSWLMVDKWNFLRKAHISEDNQYFSLEIHPLNLHKVPIYFKSAKPIFLKDILKEFTDIIFISATLYPDIFSMRMGLNNWNKHICKVSSYHIPSLNYQFVIPKYLTSKYKKRKEMIPKYADLLNDLIDYSQDKKALVFAPSKALTDEIYLKFNGENPLFQNKRKKLVHWSWIRSAESRGIDLRDYNICLIAGLPFPPINDLLSRFRFSNLKKEFPTDSWRIFRSDIIKEVIQAFCRILRKPSDRALIVLGDERYQQKDYLSLFPHYFQERTVIAKTEEEMNQICSKFFTKSINSLDSYDSQSIIKEVKN